MEKNKLFERLHGFACGVNELTKPTISVGVLSLDMHKIIANALHCRCNKAVLVCETDILGKRECSIVNVREIRLKQKT